MMTELVTHNGDQQGVTETEENSSPQLDNSEAKRQDSNQTNSKPADEKLDSEYAAQEQAISDENIESEQVTSPNKDVVQEEVKVEETNTVIAKQEENSESAGKEEQEAKEYDLELVNRRRQEEKELFQKLIDDVTRLEHEKSNLTKELNDLNMRNNVVVIELDSERDRTQELEGKIHTLELQIGKLTSEYQNYQSKMAESPQPIASPENQYESLELNKIETQHDELDEMRMRLRLMVKGDEEKSRQIENLEDTLSSYKVLLQHIEQEIGQQRLVELKEKSHAHLSEVSEKSIKGYRSNQVYPDSQIQQSKVCNIL